MTNMELNATPTAPAAPDPAVMQTAIDIWTALRDAMVKDGIFPASITKSGDTTGKVLLDIAGTLNAQSPQMAPQDQPLIPMAHHPAPGVQVVAKDADGLFHILRWQEKGGWHRGKVKASVIKYQGWRFAELPK